MPFNYTTVQPLRSKDSDRQRRVLVASGPASYVSGGESLPAADLGLGRVDLVLGGLARASAGATVRLVAYDYTTNALQWYDLAGNEIAGGVDLSDYSVRLEIAGQ